MMYLLDTEIVLELRRAKAGQADPGLAAWAAGLPRQSLFLSALSLIEIENGATRLTRRDRAAALALRSWIDEQLLPAFEGRLLAVDAAVVRRRRQLPYADARDGLLAATAIEHGLTLATRKIATFRADRMKLFNPWEYKPEAKDEDGDWRHAARARPLWLKNLFVRS